MNKYLSLAPMKYWSPKAEQKVEEDILQHPEKYSNYIGSKKLDGEWAKVVWDGDQVYILSRSVSKKTGEYARKEDKLPHLVKAFKKLPANTCILGEVCYQDLAKRSKDVGTILRCLAEEAIERQESIEDRLHFYIFDVLCYAGQDLLNTGFSTRITFIDQVKAILNDESFIHYAEFKTTAEIAEEFESYLAQGGEGYVLQHKDNIYTAGKRPAWKTIKLKKVTDDIELPIVGFLKPERIYTGKEIESWEYWEGDVPVTKYHYNKWVAGIQVKNGDTICNVSSGITDDDAKWLSTDEAKKLLEEGRLIAQVSAMEVEPDTGKLRHGRLLSIRTDLK